MSTPSLPSVPKPLIAASYERSATNKPGVIEGQYAGNRRRALEDGYDIPDSPSFRFIDNGVAGNGDPMRRPGFSALADAIAKEGITRVYMRDLYRLGRWPDLRESLRWHMWFLKRGVSLHCSDYVVNGDHLPDMLGRLADSWRGRPKGGPRRKK